MYGNTVLGSDKIWHAKISDEWKISGIDHSE